MSILVLGTVALDSVKTPSGARKNILGGSAAHFAMSARLFTDVHLVAIVGSDFPKKYIDFLKRKKIDLSSLTVSRGRTFQWKGKYEGDLNTAITLDTRLGVLPEFRPCVHDAQKKIQFIFLANVDPDIQRHLLEKVACSAFVGLDSMNYWILHRRSSLLRLLKAVDVFVANDQEARLLSQEANLIKAAKFLINQGPRIVLIKKGEHGALLYTKDFIFSLPAYPTDKVIDPTGAGDTFAGGFMGYLASVKRINQANLKLAAAYGTIAASFNVEDFGLDGTSYLNKRDLGKRLIQLRKYVAF